MIINKNILRLSPLKVITIILMTSSALIFFSAFKTKGTDNEPLTKNVDSTIAKDDMDTAAQRTEESKQAFLKAYKVFMHPRCMNCHPNGNQPLQGDDSHIHLQNVTRGVDGKGVFAVKCKNCHQDANLPIFSSPPGNPHWQMPPANRPMVFQGKSARELAIHFKDNSFTGFKTMADMVKHVEEESLVVSSFSPPAGFTKIPMSHEEFVAIVKEWIDKGAAIPDK